jgi:3-hydroxybutyryl-CoA dehydratase
VTVSERRWPPFPEVTHTITRATIDAYAELTGDYNPLHMDPQYAAATAFRGVIAHGPIALQAVFAAVSKWLGTDGLPSGLLIETAYRAPVHIGDTITCRGDPPGEYAGAVIVHSSCVNQDGAEVLQALVVAPRGLAPAIVPAER